MVAAVQSALDDAYAGVLLSDFSGGRNTEADPQDLKPNEAAECLNVKFRPGRLIGRNGYVLLISNLPAKNDGIAFFFDSGGNRRQVVWSNGSIYQVTFGIASLIAAAVYTAGNSVCHTTYAGVIYYSDGVIPLRRWNPITATEQAVPNAGGVGTIAPPAAKVLATSQGCIVAGATTVGGFFEGDLIRWCNVNDPTTWLALSFQAVGQGTGGEVNSINNMGVSDQGVSPFKALFVGKSRDGVFGLQGALGSLQEFLIPASTGVLDGRTVKFMPGPDGRAYVVWLGTDREVWYTNGISADKLSANIRTELNTAILNRIQNIASPHFNAVINLIDYQYVLDVGGGLFFVYDYYGQAWTQYSGWPSGYWAEGVDVTGFPAIYVASDSAGQFSQANFGDTDNGSMITFSWTTGFLNAGNAERLKDWDFLYATFATDSGQLEITVTPATGRDGAGNPATGVITAPPSAGSPFVLDSSLLDGPDVLTVGAQGDFNVYQRKIRLRVPVAAYPGITEKLRGSSVQMNIKQSLVQGHFELFSAKLLYLNRGYKRVG